MLGRLRRRARETEGDASFSVMYLQVGTIGQNAIEGEQVWERED